MTSAIPDLDNNKMHITRDQFNEFCVQISTHSKDWNWITTQQNKDIGYLQRRCTLLVKKEAEKSVDDAVADIEFDDEITEDDSLIELSAAANDSSQFDGQSSDNIELYQAEYHIVYWPSYSVPTLFFNAYRISDGTPVSDSSVFLRCEAAANSSLRPEAAPVVHVRPIPEGQNPWTFITQGEHPILGEVFYYLHPCQTADFMGLVLSTTTATSAAATSSSSSTTTTTTAAAAATTTTATATATPTAAAAMDSEYTECGNFVLSWLSFFGPVVGLRVSAELFTAVLQRQQQQQL